MDFAAHRAQESATGRGSLAHGLCVGAWSARSTERIRAAACQAANLFCVSAEKMGPEWRRWKEEGRRESSVFRVQREYFEAANSAPVR